MSKLLTLKGYFKGFCKVKAMTTLSRDMSQRIIAVCQMTSTNDKEKNLNTIKKMVAEAKKANAKVIFFPEACDFVGSSREETLQLAEPLDGPLVTSYRELAKEQKVWLSLGGIHEAVGNEKVRNTHLVINEEGEIVGYYSKIHLFDVDLPEQNLHIKESSYTERGEGITNPVDTPVGRVGLSICYDMRFPELSLTLRSLGAEILTYPSAFTKSTGAAHWEVLLRSKAVETQCYVVAAAQTGVHNKKRESWGHSIVVDPWGTVVAQCSEGEGLTYATIKFDYVNQIRDSLPVFQHRRTDLYPAMFYRKLRETPLEDFYDFGQAKISKETIFFKTDLTIAFTNIRCVVPGHVLIAPIRPVQRFTNLYPDEVGDLFLVTQIVQKAVEKLYDASSSSLVIQDGPEAGQTIKHVHVHILPRKSGDFYWNDEVYEELKRQEKDLTRPCRSEEEMRAEAEIIRKAIKAKK